MVKKTDSKTNYWGLLFSGLLLTAFIVGLVFAPIITLIVAASLIGFAAVCFSIMVISAVKTMINIAETLTPAFQTGAALATVGAATVLAPMTDGKSIEAARKLTTAHTKNEDKKPETVRSVGQNSVFSKGPERNKSKQKDDEETSQLRARAFN